MLEPNALASGGGAETRSQCQIYSRPLIRFDDETTGDGVWDLEQQRYHNDVNEIDGNSGNSITLQSGGAGTNWADPVHDEAGNMTTIPQPQDPNSSYTLKYDAWNRLVEVKGKGTFYFFK